MPQTLALVDTVLKTFYVQKVVNLINKKTTMLDIFEDGDASGLTVDGKNVVYALRTNRNQGVGAVGSGKVLPKAGYQETVNVTIPHRYTYGRIQLEAQTIKQSKTNKGAFIKALTLEMNGLKDDMSKARNRMLWGDGTGVLAKVSGGALASATTINVKDPGGVTGSVNGARFLQPGMSIAIIRSATPATASDSDIVGTGSAVTAVSTNGASITISAGGFGAVALNDGDLIVAQPAGTDSSAQTSINREPMGLRGLVDDGTYQSSIFGVSRTTYPKFKANIISLGDVFNVDSADRVLDLCEERGNGEVKKIVGHHSAVREYEKLCMQFKRYLGKDAKNPDLGFTQNGADLTFSDRPMVKDRMAPYNQFYFIDASSATRYALVNAEWADEDGTILLRTTDNTDSYEARFRIFDNFMIDNMNSCGRLDDLQGATIDPINVE